MQGLTDKNFGLLIAYILPGFVILCGMSLASETVSAWLRADSENAPTVAGFLYLTLASIGAGLLASTLRWLVIDSIHHRTGIEEPEWNFGKIGSDTSAFQVLVDGHYRYYQFYANSVVAVALFFGFCVWFDRAPLWSGIPFLLLESLLWFASRDALHRYYMKFESLAIRESRKRSGV